ncbi:hypothetical protein [Microviridae sp.]|nr:hypothetical protein [Microviridae sp.]
MCGIRFVSKEKSGRSAATCAENLGNAWVSLKIPPTGRYGSITLPPAAKFSSCHHYLKISHPGKILPTTIHPGRWHMAKKKSKSSSRKSTSAQTIKRVRQTAANILRTQSRARKEITHVQRQKQATPPPLPPRDPRAAQRAQQKVRQSGTARTLVRSPRDPDPRRPPGDNLCRRRADRRGVILATGHGGINGATNYSTRSKHSCKK